MASKFYVQLERFFFFFGSFMLIIGFLYWAQSFFIPLTIAVLLTFILTPLVSLLQRWGLPRVPSILVVVVLVFLFLGGLGTLFYSQMKSLAQVLPSYRTQIQDKINSLKDATNESWISNFQEFLNSLNETAAEQGLIPVEKIERVSVRQESSMFPVVQTIAGTLFEAFVHVLLVFILVVFMLVKREDLRNRIIRLWGHSNLTSTTRAMDDASQRVSRFLFFQLILNTVFGTVLAIGLAIIGIPYAFIWGFLAVFLRYLPYIGPWFAAFFPLLISLVLPGWAPFFEVAIFFLLLELVHSNVVEPLLFGHSIGVSGVALLISAMFWTWLWGPLGLVLSTPMTACLYVFGRHVPVLQFIPILLGDEPVMDQPIVFYQRLLAHDPEEAEDVLQQFLKDHTAEEVYDEMFLPTLLLAQKDRDNEDLTDEDQTFVLETIRDLFHDVVLPGQAAAAEKLAAMPASASASPSMPILASTPMPTSAPAVPALILGVAVRNETDSLALEIFKDLLKVEKYRYVVATPKILQDESLAGENPAAVLLVTLSNQNMTRTRIFCKQIRTLFPHSKIIVGCWGLTQKESLARERLKASGADAMSMNFLETLSLLKEGE